MNKTMIATDAAPGAIGPYCQATRVGKLLYTSGQIPLDPATMDIVAGGIAEQTRRVMDNLMAVLAAADANADTVIKTTCFLSDMENFGAFNEVYATYFGDSKPARSPLASSSSSTTR